MISQLRRGIWGKILGHCGNCGEFEGGHSFSGAHTRICKAEGWYRMVEEVEGRFVRNDRRFRRR